jgi:hypothetical protein
MLDLQAALVFIPRFHQNSFLGGSLAFAVGDSRTCFAKAVEGTSVHRGAVPQRCYCAPTLLR